MHKFRAKWPWMAISVLISRDAHQNGLEAKVALRGKPEGPTRPGCVSLVTLLCTSKESDSPSEGEIKLAAHDAKSVNNRMSRMHSHAEHGNENK